jgi:hypothetical protein
MRPERAPSLVALAAAFEALNKAALHVTGVREWIERFEGEPLDGEEAARLWVFTELTRQLSRRLRADADQLAELLVSQFLAEGQAWPLTPEQEREFHEVLATLSARDADSHRERLEQGTGVDHGRESR